MQYALQTKMENVIDFKSDLVTNVKCPKVQLFFSIINSKMI